MSVEPVQVPAAGAKSTYLAPEVRDGYEVHRAALSRGLDVALYPRQVLMVTNPGDGRELSFIHGIPESSALGSVTFAQDKRMRRALLERAGLPLPKGATFSVGRGMRDARNFAARIGYPVVVKPAMGDNAIETFPGVTDEEELGQVVDYLRTPPTERETYTRAAYALTELREPGEMEGRIVVPPGYRILIEEHVHGEYVRFLVVGGLARSVVQCPGPPARTHGEPGRDILGEVHPTLQQLAIDAVRAIPGLAVGAVDIVVSDPGRPATDQPVWIVEVSERPGLAVHADISEELSGRLGDVLLDQHAIEEGTTLPEPAGEVTVSLHIEAIPDLDGAVEVLAEAARARGLTGNIGVSDRVEGVADGVVQGPAGHVAWLAESLLDGTLGGHRAMLVEERQHASEAFDTFTMRS